MNSVLVAFSLAQPVLNTTHDISKQHSTIDNISNKNTPTTPPNCPYEFHGLSLSKLTQFCESIIESPCSYEIKPITLNTFSVEGASAATRYVILLSGPPSQIIATQRSLLEKYPSEASVTLKVRCRRDLCEGDTWKPEVQVQIDDIIRDEGVDINFSPVNTEVFADFKSGSNDTYLSINGKPSSVEKVRQEIVRLEQSHVSGI
ncbi:hypothetical protein K7432_015158 [Basidiobolus ranarum]|uniref:Uncharacterized protein n=1 Tax=Basidiobolus ranarum TaxID=34480 RepID=A0ABR2VPD1_9FUNG